MIGSFTKRLIAAACRAMKLLFTASSLFLNTMRSVVAHGIWMKDHESDSLRPRSAVLAARRAAGSRASDQLANYSHGPWSSTTDRYSAIPMAFRLGLHVRRFRPTTRTIRVRAFHEPGC